MRGDRVCCVSDPFVYSAASGPSGYYLTGEGLCLIYRYRETLASVPHSLLPLPPQPRRPSHKAKRSSSYSALYLLLFLFLSFLLPDTRFPTHIHSYSSVPQGSPTSKQALILPPGLPVPGLPFFERQRAARYSTDTYL